MGGRQSGCHRLDVRNGRPFLLVLEGHHFPGFRVGQQGLEGGVVEGVPRLVCNKLANQGVAQLIQVADGVEDLVLDELVLVAQPLFIEDLLLVHHDGDVEAAATSQTDGAQVIDLVHKAEGARPAHLLDKGTGGKVHTGVKGFAGERRVVEVDGEVHPEALVGPEGCHLVAVLHLHFALDANELLGGVLLDNAGGLDQEHKGTRTAVHDGHFRGGELNNGIVDAQSRHGGQQVLHGGDTHLPLDQGGGQRGGADIVGLGADVNGGNQVGAAKDDTSIGRGGLEGKVYLLAGVEAHTRGADTVVQGSLSDH